MKLIYIILTILTIFLVGASFQTSPNKDIVYNGKYIGLSPVPVQLPEIEAWKQAEASARQHEGGRVVRGSGDSMWPLYPNGTILVVVPREFDKIKVGQTVLYWKPNGRVVSHLIVSKSGDSWKASGINNPDEDRETIHRGNYLGTVISAYQPTGQTLFRNSGVTK